MQWRRRALAAAIVAVMFVPALVFGAGSSTIYQCRPALPSTSLADRADQPRTPPRIPVTLDEQSLISPSDLGTPGGLRVLSPRGASWQAIMLTYDTPRLYQIRKQIGSEFRGIARLDSASVPSSVRSQFVPDADFYIGPNTCKTEDFYPSY
jgi:hypothetical protein